MKKQYYFTKVKIFCILQVLFLTLAIVGTMLLCYRGWKPEAAV